MRVAYSGSFFRLLFRFLANHSGRGRAVEEPEMVYTGTAEWLLIFMAIQFHLRVLFVLYLIVAVGRDVEHIGRERVSKSSKPAYFLAWQRLYPTPIFRVHVPNRANYPKLRTEGLRLGTVAARLHFWVMSDQQLLCSNAHHPRNQSIALCTGALLIQAFRMFLICPRRSSSTAHSYSMSCYKSQRRSAHEWGHGLP